MIVVNPSILSHAGIQFSAGVTATVLVSFIGGCAMGLYARSPILVAPGMGINALFAYTMVVGAKVPLEIALGCVFWAGVLFTVMAFFNLRQTIIEAIPVDLRYGIACGIGLFIALIGFENAKFIIANPDTIVGLTTFRPSNPHLHCRLHPDGRAGGPQSSRRDDGRHDPHHHPLHPDRPLVGRRRRISAEYA